MRSMLPLGLLGLILCIGCSKSSPSFKNVGVRDSADAKKALENLAPEFAEAKKPTAEQAPEFVAHQEPGQPNVGGQQKKPKAEPQRKIRYTADLRVIVDDFAKAEKDLESAIDDAKGKLANSELNSAANAVRTGTWRVRVPVENLHAFRTAVARIGEVELNKLDSEDLTDRYYDLEAHIKNRNAEREALRDLLKEVGKKEIKHYLEIKRELDSVSDDINRKEGQLRLWANLTDLTTCNVTLREKQKYLEKKVEEKEVPSFRMRAGKTWGDSWEAFLGFCQGTVLLAIALTPWLPVFIVIGSGLWLLVRRLGRKHEPPTLVTPIEESASNPA